MSAKKHTTWLLSLGLATLIGAVPSVGAQPFDPPHAGVWFGIDPNDGSEAWIAVDSNLDFVFFDSNATFGCSQTGGGAFYGVAMNGLLEGDLLSGRIEGLCQLNQGTLEFDMVLEYLPMTDQLSTRGGLFYKAANADGNAFVQGALEMRAVSPTGWAFIDLILAGAPERAEPPVGWSCFEPIWLQPYADFRNCDLRGIVDQSVNLAGADLRGANLSGAELPRADLRASLLSNANLANADLRRSSMVGADLSDADLSHAKLMRIDAEGAQLRFATLKGANLRGAHLRGAELWFANLTVANLRNADLTDTYLASADLSFANLENANLVGANLVGSNLTGANLTGVTEDVHTVWGSAICPDGTMAATESCLDHPAAGVQ